MKVTSLNNLLPEVEPIDPYKRLAAAVVIAAVRDLRSDEPGRALDAALWLCGDARFFSESCGLETDPASWLVNGARLPHYGRIKA
jgi:hypothetical protein